MTNVAFDEDQGLPIGTSTRPRGFSRALVKWGVAQTDLQANILLVLFALIVGAVAVYVFMTSQPTPHVITPAEQLELERMQAAGKNR